MFQYVSIFIFMMKEQLNTWLISEQCLNTAPGYILIQTGLQGQQDKLEHISQYVDWTKYDWAPILRRTDIEGKRASSFIWDASSTIQNPLFSHMIRTLLLKCAFPIPSTEFMSYGKYVQDEYRHASIKRKTSFALATNLP